MDIVYAFVEIFFPKRYIFILTYTKQKRVSGRCNFFQRKSRCSTVAELQQSVYIYYIYTPKIITVVTFLQFGRKITRQVAFRSEAATSNVVNGSPYLQAKPPPTATDATPFSITLLAF